jgi:CheY-like chemotaxis protein
MEKFNQHLSILTDACKDSIEQMTNLKIQNVEIKKAPELEKKLSFAHIISYKDHEEKVDGNFILAFEGNDAALNLASAIAVRLGMDKFEDICEDSTDLLNEFLNVVVGRTISEWDSIGLRVSFGTPVFKKDYLSKGSQQSEPYQISMDVLSDSVNLDAKNSVRQMTLRVDFSTKIENKIDGKKILLVDDSRVMRNIIAKVLKKHGARIVEAGDGEEAITVHKKHNPDLTLMDINMPKMNGLESIVHIKEFMPNAKFIILSSSSRKDEIMTAKTLDAAGYLVKPADPDKLIKKVSEQF